MLNKLFLLCCFFPFVSPFPIGSDIQPLAGILAAFIVLRKAVSEKTFKPLLLIALFVPIFLLAYNNPFSRFLEIDVGKLVSLSFGAFIIVGFYYAKHELSNKLFICIVSFYLLFTILLLLFTEPMIAIQNLVIRNTNATDYTYRGVATLVTEPGLFGGLLVFFLIITDYLYKYKNMSKITKYIIYGMVIFMLLMTKSGTGYLYFIIYIGIKYFTGEYKLRYKLAFFPLIVLVGGVVFLFGHQIGVGAFGRGADVIIQLADPTSLMLSDSSILTRVVDFYLGLVSIFHYPFGVGNTAALNKAEQLMAVTPFVQNFYMNTGKAFGSNSSFTMLTISYGLLFWLYLLFLFCYVSNSSASAKFFAFLYLSVSYSAAFPAIWILIALHIRGESKISNRKDTVNEVSQK
ncbi:hypothetical protein ACFQ0F_06445 [Paraperlucidibaca wandonensis]|uniref:O-antigen ligase-like membrane protein n=1 Tax=Paraperlucidibaca wandonensis TaxID=1268273 RepID=A0ABW3HFM8_9GAMM